MNYNHLFSPIKRSLNPLKKGDKMWYLCTSTTTTKKVTIIDVHHDTSPAYYTIKLPDNTKKQTIRSRLFYSAKAVPLAQRARQGLIS